MLLEVALVSLITYLFVRWLQELCSVPPNLPPGPRLRFPLFGHLPLLSGNAHVDFARWGKKYGKLFHLWMGEKLVVVVNDYELIKEAFKREEFSGRPDMFLFNFTTENRTQGVILSEGHTWQHNRRFCLSALRDMGMGKSSMEFKILQEISVLTKVIEGKERQAFNCAKLLDISVANIICDIVFNRRFSHDDPKFLTFLECIQENFQVTGSAFALNFLPFLRYFPRLTGFDKMQEGQGNRNFLLDMVAERGEKFDPSNVRNFVDAHLLQQKQAREGAGGDPDIFCNKQLGYLVGELFAAGSDTTTTTLRWALLYMMISPDIQKKVQREIDDVVGPDGQPCMQHKSRMPYTEACIMEIQRLANTVPLGVMHANNMGPAELGGYTIPAGTAIFPNLYAVHSDPKLWPEPAEFRPQRFLGPDGKVVKPDGFVPFSMGKRKCLGEGLAKMELFLFFTCLMQKFCFQLPEGAARPDMNGVLGMTLTPKPFRLCAIPRYHCKY